MTKKDIIITKPNKYHNGKIYTIRCKDDDNLIYVGSSCLPLHKRFYQHKQKMKQDKYKNRLIYIKMNEKYQCECSCIISKSSKFHHLKTKNHKNLMDAQSILNIPISCSAI